MKMDGTSWRIWNLGFAILLSVWANFWQIWHIKLYIILTWAKERMQVGQTLAAVKYNVRRWSFLFFFGQGRATYLMVLQLQPSSHLLTRHTSQFFRVVNQLGHWKYIERCLSLCYNTFRVLTSGKARVLRRFDTIACGLQFVSLWHVKNTCKTCWGRK